MQSTKDIESERLRRDDVDPFEALFSCATASLERHRPISVQQDARSLGHVCTAGYEDQEFDDD